MPHQASPEASVAGTRDRVLDGRVVIEQPENGYRVAIDAIFLAAAVGAKRAETALDLGCGVGTGSLCLAHRVPGISIIAVDREPTFIEFAKRNVVANGFESSIQCLVGDVLKLSQSLGRARADHVMANPPYLKRDSSTVSANPLKAAATAEGEAKLPDWINAAASVLKPGGDLTMIHRADRLPEILDCLNSDFGAVAVRPLQPKSGAIAKRVIVRAVLKASKSVTILPGLVLHEADGSFTMDADAVLRNGRALPMT